MIDTLGDALPREIARVRDELIPMYQEIGAPGMPAIFLMRQSLDAATKAMIEGDVVAMLCAYEDLKGFTS